MSLDFDRLPESVKQQILQLQNLEQQKESIEIQKRHVESRLVEIENALKKIEENKDAKIYKSIGSILIEEDGEKLKKELEDEKETLEVRKRTLLKQDEKIKKRAGEIQAKIRSELGATGVGG